MWLYRLNHFLGPMIGSFWRLGLEGRIDAIPPEGPLLLAPNHSSYLDPWFLGMAFPRLIRYLITDEWFYRNRSWRLFFEAFGTIPARNRNPRATIEAVCEALGRGDVIGIFPEGGISSDGHLQPFQTGIARIAAMSGAPVMPVGIRGAFESLPRTSLLPRPVRVRIHLGEPLRFPGTLVDGRLDRDAAADFVQRLREAVCRLSGRDAPASLNADPAPPGPEGARGA